MEINAAISALAALAQENRLAIYRYLMERFPEGVPSGRLADKLAMPASTMSTHLKILVQAGLVRSWRSSRLVNYAIDVEGSRNLIDFLTRDCCRGHPEICGYPQDMAGDADALNRVSERGCVDE